MPTTRIASRLSWSRRWGERDDPGTTTVTMAGKRIGLGPADEPFRRPGKERVERAIAAGLLVLTSPVLLACAASIKIEALLDPMARGPVLFREDRISRGRVIRMLKFRTLTASALASLEAGPTHIAKLEKAGHVTRSGRVIRQWYLDELPQLINIARGDMFIVGTRPYPIELYEQELARGITRKRDMPGGWVGPVQANKGVEDGDSGRRLDEEYWEQYQTLPWWRLVIVDSQIVWRSFRVQLRHEGI